MWTDAGPAWSLVARATTACGGRGGAHESARAAVGRTRVQVYLAAVCGVGVAVREARVASDHTTAGRAGGGAVVTAAHGPARATVGGGVETGLAAVGGVGVAVREAR